MKYNRAASQALLQFGLLILIMGTMTGCTGGKQASGGDPDTITAEQIQNTGTVSNAYILVKRFHPDWLQKRGTSSINRVSTVVIYVEGDRRGGPESLRRINVMDVESIEYFDSDEATLKFGSGHDHGAIQVQLKEMN